MLNQHSSAPLTTMCDPHPLHSCRRPARGRDPPPSHELNPNCHNTINSEIIGDVFALHTTHNNHLFLVTSLDFTLVPRPLQIGSKLAHRPGMFARTIICLAEFREICDVRSVCFAADRLSGFEHQAACECCSVLHICNTGASGLLSAALQAICWRKAVKSCTCPELGYKAAVYVYMFLCIYL